MTNVEQTLTRSMIIIFDAFNNSSLSAAEDGFKISRMRQELQGLLDEKEDPIEKIRKANKK